MTSSINWRLNYDVAESVRASQLISRSLKLQAALWAGASTDLERFLAVERLLERDSAYRGRFTFVQIGAPSRTHIKRYRDLLTEVEAEADPVRGALCR